MTATPSRASFTAAAVVLALMTSACGASRSSLVAGSATTLVLGTVILVAPGGSSEDPGPPNEGAAIVFGTGLILAGITCAVLAIARGPER